MVFISVRLVIAVWWLAILTGSVYLQVLFMIAELG